MIVTNLRGKITELFVLSKIICQLVQAKYKNTRQLCQSNYKRKANSGRKNVRHLKEHKQKCKPKRKSAHTYVKPPNLISSFWKSNKYQQLKFTYLTGKNPID